MSRRAGSARRHRRAVERVIARLRAEPSARPTLGELAALGHMSPYHFDRVFRRVTGLPPMHFLSALRMDAAKRLLLSTDLSVTEICWEVGFRSLGSFSERFSQAVGLPPSRFRALQETRTREVRERLDAMRVRCAEDADDAGNTTSHRALRGRIDGAPAGDPVIVGLFAAGAPSGMPLACGVLTAPGRFRLPAPSGGGPVRVFAATLPWSSGRRRLLTDARLQASVAHDGGAETETHRIDLTLHPPSPLEPPLLLSIPALLRAQTEPTPRKIGV